MELTHKGTIQLETERLILRRFTSADDTTMFNNWANDPEVTKYLTWQTHAANLSAIVYWITPTVTCFTWR